MTWMQRALKWLTERLDPPRVIYDRMGISEYLSRYYLIGAPKASDGKPVFDKTGVPRPDIEWTGDRIGPVAVYLHKFHRSDEDGDPHSHPWRWSVAIILSGGYREQRLDRRTNTLRTRTMLPGFVNIIRGDDYHRVDLIGSESWSLFIAGPKASSWGFWNIEMRTHVPWREFIARKRGQSAEEVKVS